MDATMEAKMGLPPPYEPTPSHPPPPPAYSTLPPSAPPPSVNPPLPHTTVVVRPAATVALGPGRTGLKCPHCQESVVTNVVYTPNTKTHIVAGVLCILASCCCLSCLPYCMPSCKTTNHSCPKCKAFIGTYTPS